MNDELFKLGQTALQNQAFSQLLGAELAEFTPERVELRITVRQEHMQHMGFVHGGVLSYLADNAITFMGSVALGPQVVTQEFKINYLRPARDGVLIARAALVYGSKRQAVCRCDVFVLDAAGEEKLCAAAQGTIMLAAT